MTRNLGSSISSCKLPLSAVSRRGDSGDPSISLLSQSPAAARRARVCRSWTSGYGYGSLVEDRANSDEVIPGPTGGKKRGVKQKQVFPLRSLRRAASSAVLSGAPDASCGGSRARLDLLMPSLRSLVSRRPTRPSADMGGGASSSAPPPSRATHPLLGGAVPLVKREGSCGSLAPTIRLEDVSETPSGGAGEMRKCETMLALSGLGAMLRSASSSRSTLHVEPLAAVNRLRVPPLSPGGSSSRMCSRCSSLLSMASSSRYSLNAAGGGFVASSGPLSLCKLCLGEVPVKDMTEIQQCGCSFCTDCMKSYLEFEIQEAAYDISCPDALCEKQGVISLEEVENLVTEQLMDKHKRFRLDREVDMDCSRSWCPRAGCETVCSVCPAGGCLPQSVHCPTCTSDFCSNCKGPWHPGLSCEENSRRSNQEPGIPFDSDLIKCCPMCNVPIEKDEGCAQMMCKRCKHVFCWYCLASLDDDFLLRHYDKGPCKNKLGHSRASVIWHRTQVIGIFAGFGILLLVASPLLLLAAPCIVCCKCRVCSGGTKLDSEEELPEESAS